MNAHDLLIYLDMDGTMLSDWNLGPIVPEPNLTALRAFIGMGGAVSVATGRQYTDTLSYFPGIEFSAPLVLGNGSVIFDQISDSVLSREGLPRSSFLEAVDFVKRCSDIWLVAADEKHLYQLSESPEKDVRLTDGFYREKCPEEKLVALELTKMCFICADASRMPSLTEQVGRLKSWPLVSASQSAPIYLEVMKRGVSKAQGIKKAVALAALQNRRLVCLGDFLNDMEMLKMADIAACPANAAPEILAISQIVTCSNNDGAFADLIGKLL